MSGILFADGKAFLCKISEIVDDIERKPTTEIIKLLMNSN